MKKFLALVPKEAISSNDKTPYTFPEKLAIFSNGFISDVFDLCVSKT